MSCSLYEEKMAKMVHKCNPRWPLCIWLLWLLMADRHSHCNVQWSTKDNALAPARGGEAVEEEI